MLFRSSGGSSITQQLAKNVYIEPDERFERSIDRKAKEVVLALELTRRYSKEQILEWYLNSISYGSIYVGIEAASQGFFGKAFGPVQASEVASVNLGARQSQLVKPTLGRSIARFVGMTKKADPPARKQSHCIGMDIVTRSEHRHHTAIVLPGFAEDEVKCGKQIRAAFH